MKIAFIIDSPPLKQPFTRLLISRHQPANVLGQLMWFSRWELRCWHRWRWERHCWPSDRQLKSGVSFSWSITAVCLKEYPLLGRVQCLSVWSVISAFSWLFPLWRLKTIYIIYILIRFGKVHALRGNSLLSSILPESVSRLIYLLTRLSARIFFSVSLCTSWRKNTYFLNRLQNVLLSGLIFTRLISLCKIKLLERKK